MAGGESNVDFDAMAKARTQFEQASTEAHSHRDQVERSKEYAMSVWRGESADGYFQAIDAWLTQFDVVTTNLDNLTSALGEALGGYRAKEEGNKQRSSSLTATINAQ
jgi:WXG100 family type VII secretion target